MQNLGLILIICRDIITKHNKKVIKYYIIDMFKFWISYNTINSLYSILYKHFS